MKQDNEFMLLFRFSPNLDQQPTEEELLNMQNQWGEFIGHLMISEKLITTHRLGFEGVHVHSDLSTDNQIVMNKAMTLSGNMVIKSQSIEEATEIAKACPILNMGGSVEIRNIIPMN